MTRVVLVTRRSFLGTMFSTGALVLCAWHGHHVELRSDVDPSGAGMDHAKVS